MEVCPCHGGTCTSVMASLMLKGIDSCWNKSLCHSKWQRTKNVHSATATTTFLSFQMQLLALEISHLHLAKLQSNGRGNCCELLLKTMQEDEEEE